MRKIGFGVAGAVLVVVALFATGLIGDPWSDSPTSDSNVSSSLTPAPTTRDADFLNALGGQVTSVSPAVAEGMGNRACSALSEGTSAAEVRAVLVQKGLTAAEATRVVLAAVTMYCVENQDLVMGVSKKSDSRS